MEIYLENMEMKNGTFASWSGVAALWCLIFSFITGVFFIFQFVHYGFTPISIRAIGIIILLVSLGLIRFKKQGT